MEYPRPQLRRPQWQSLDGIWQFAFDDAARWALPADVAFDRHITVPYAPESQRSGIADTGFHPRCWYHRTVELAAHGILRSVATGERAVGGQIGGEQRDIAALGAEGDPCGRGGHS